MEKLAKAFSIILGPQFWLPAIFLTFLLKSDLNRNQLFILGPSILILQVLLPLSYLFLAPKLGWAGGWDLKTRQEKSVMLLVCLLFSTISLILVYVLGNTLLLQLMILLLFLSCLFLLVNHFWQISLHAGLNTAGSILINFLFDWKLPWLYLSIPIVCWSRLFLKRHTSLQLLGGILLSATVVLLGLYVL